MSERKKDNVIYSECHRFPLSRLHNEGLLEANDILLARLRVGFPHFCFVFYLTLSHCSCCLRYLVLTILPATLDSIAFSRSLFSFFSLPTLTASLRDHRLRCVYCMKKYRLYIHLAYVYQAKSPSSITRNSIGRTRLGQTGGFDGETGWKFDQKNRPRRLVAEALGYSRIG